jgi:phytoene dehydrogenase-like protein
MHKAFTGVSGHESCILKKSKLEGVLGMMKTDVIVVGGGAAGLTAAAYVAQAGHSVMVFEKDAAFGGLLGSFDLFGHRVDKGARGIIDSGIIFPMLKQLKVSVDFLPNPIRIQIGDRSIDLHGEQGLADYHALLIHHFPQEKDAIDRIMADIRTVMRQMDVIYGIENPLFLPKPYDLRYVTKTLLPWMGKFFINIRKAMGRMEPIEDYLKKMTANQALIDMIAQHFFAQTPAFFALSYFTLYQQYHYPKGGTQSLIDALLSVIRNGGGVLRNSCEVKSIDPTQQTLTTCNDEVVHYRQLIWAGDTNTFYSTLDLTTMQDAALKQKVLKRQAELKALRGADSILTLYVIVKQDASVFASTSGPHAFYTPKTTGLSKYPLSSLKDDQGQWTTDPQRLLDYVDAIVEANTFEISVPSLRDASMSPPGETALILSTLFDYGLTEHIAKLGLLPEFKTRITAKFLTVLKALWPGLQASVKHTNLATPLTIKSRTNAHEGSVTGWSFANRPFPVETQFLRVSQAVKTPIPTIKQAGQWTFNPAGVPVAVMTGKLAADAVLKDLTGRKP